MQQYKVQVHWTPRDVPLVKISPEPLRIHGQSRTRVSRAEPVALVFIYCQDHQKRGSRLPSEGQLIWPKGKWHLLSSYDQDNLGKHNTICFECMFRRPSEGIVTIAETKFIVSYWHSPNLVVSNVRPSYNPCYFSNRQTPCKKTSPARK